MNSNTFFLSLILVAACGGSVNSPSSKEPVTQVPSAQPSSAPSSAATAAPAGTPSLGGTPLMRGTQMAEDLQSVGLDVKALPELGKLKPEQLRKVMATFSKALGVSCKDCHGAGGFSAPTPMKKVTTRMWNEFTRGQVFAGELAPQGLYCDSCHQGKVHMLDRSDKKALGQWMHAEFTSKLARSAGGTNSCASCHGEPFVPNFLASWQK